MSKENSPMVNGIACTGVRHVVQSAITIFAVPVTKSKGHEKSMWTIE